MLVKETIPTHNERRQKGTKANRCPRLTKSARFLAIKEADKMEKLTRTYLEEIVRLRGVPKSIISDRDSRITTRFLAVTAEGLENETR